MHASHPLERFTLNIIDSWQMAIFNESHSWGFGQPSGVWREQFVLHCCDTFHSFKLHHEWKLGPFDGWIEERFKCTSEIVHNLLKNIVNTARETRMAYLNSFADFGHNDFLSIATFFAGGNLFGTGFLHDQSMKGIWARSELSLKGPLADYREILIDDAVRVSHDQEVQNDLLKPDRQKKELTVTNTRRLSRDGIDHMAVCMNNTHRRRINNLCEIVTCQTRSTYWRTPS